MGIRFTVKHTSGERCFSGWVLRAIARAPHWFELHLTSWFGRLVGSRDCRGFVNQTVRDITDHVFAQLHGPLRGEVDWHIHHDLFTHPYCAQFNESHVAFLNRLWHEAGIGYWIDYQSDDQTLQLFDHHSIYEDHHYYPLSWPGTAYRNPVFALLDARICSRAPGEHTLQEVRPHSRHRGQQDKQILAQAASSLPPATDLTTHQYSGQHPRLQQRQRAYHHRQGAVSLHAQSTLCELALGQVFTLSGRREVALEWIPVEIDHYCRDTSRLDDKHLGVPSLLPQDLTLETNTCYHNRFVAVPMPPFPHIYLPPCPHQAQVLSPMTAIVAKDDRLDEKGRIRLWFQWDSNNPQGYSGLCPWAEISQAQSGRGAGQQFIPRAGMEVVVHFIGPTLRQPIITGCLYNQQHTPPFNHQDYPGVCGIRTQVDLPTLGEHAGHSIIFDDTAGCERVIIHSAGDMHYDAQRHTRVITGSEQLIIEGHSALKVFHGGCHIEAPRGIILQVAESRLVVGEEDIVLEGPDIWFNLPGLDKTVNLATVGDKQTCPKHHGDGSPHHGGEIITGHPKVTLDGRPVATVGDKVHCDDAIATITQGHPAFCIDGRPVAITGSQTSHGGHVTQGHERVHLCPHPEASACVEDEAEDNQHKNTDQAHPTTEDDPWSSDATPPMGQALMRHVAPGHINRGIEVIRVSPKARILSPHSELGDSLSLACLPAKAQQAIISDLLTAHCPPTPEQAKDYPLFVTDKQPKALHRLTAKVTHSFTSKATATHRPMTRWDTYLADTTLLTQAQKALELSQAPSLHSGWIYIFAQCSAVPKRQFAIPRCFREYRLDNEEGDITLREINLAENAGLDTREPTGLRESFLELPYQYRYQGKVQGKFQVTVFYSPTQLSWARLQHYGGLANTDPRYLAVATEQATRLAQISAQTPVNAHALIERAGQPLNPQSLDAVYAVQYQQAHPVFIANQGLNQYPDHAQHDVFFIDTTQAHTHAPYPHLLLDAPSQLIQQANELMANLLNHLQLSIGLIGTQQEAGQANYGISALVAQQLFCRYNYHNIYQQQGAYWGLDQQPLPWQQAAQDIAVPKLQWAVNAYSRHLLHALHTALQQQTTAYLLQHWDSEHQTPKAFVPEGAWQVNLDKVIQDAFAQNIRQFGLGFIFLQSLVLPSCIDSHNYDQKLEIDNRFVDRVPRLQEYRWRLKHWLPLVETHRLTRLASHFTRRSNYLIDEVMAVLVETDTVSKELIAGRYHRVKERGRPHRVGGEHRLHYLPMPAGFAYLRALHEPTFPHHHSVFPAETVTTATMKESAEASAIYLAAQGGFNPMGFWVAWQGEGVLHQEQGDSQEQESNPNPELREGLASSATLFQLLFSGYLQQVLYCAHLDHLDTVGALIERSQRLREPYLRLLTLVEPDLAQSVHRAKAAARVRLARALKKDQGIADARAAELMSPVALVLALWEIQETIFVLERPHDLNQGLTLMAQLARDFAEAAGQCQALYRAVNRLTENKFSALAQTTAKALLFERRYYRWFTQTRLAANLQGEVSRLSASFPMLSRGFVVFGAMTAVMSCINASLGLMNCVTAGGRRDPASVLSNTLGTLAAVGQAGFKTYDVFRENRNRKVGLEIMDFTAGESFELFLTEILGIALPVSWILDIGVAACALGAFVAHLFQRDKFDQWVVNSPFYKEPNNDYFKTDAQAYGALLSLLITPKLTPRLSADKRRVTIQIELPSGLLHQSFLDSRLRCDLLLYLEDQCLNTGLGMSVIGSRVIDLDIASVLETIILRPDKNGSYHFTISEEMAERVWDATSPIGYECFVRAQLGIQIVLDDGNLLPNGVHVAKAQANTDAANPPVATARTEIVKNEHELARKDNQWLFNLGIYYDRRRKFRVVNIKLITADGQQE